MVKCSLAVHNLSPSPLIAGTHDSVAAIRVFERLATAVTPQLLPKGYWTRLRIAMLLRARATAPADTYTLRAAAGEWRELAPGVSMKLLRMDRVANNMTVFIRMQSGARLPAHQHMQAEECLLLEGEIQIGNHRIAAGDLHVAEAGTEHGVIASYAGALLLVRAEIPATSFTQAAQRRN